MLTPSRAQAAKTKGAMKKRVNQKNSSVIKKLEITFYFDPARAAAVVDEMFNNIIESKKSKGGKL